VGHIAWVLVVAQCSHALTFAAVFWAASIVGVLAALCCWRALVLERDGR